jgi:hypothetical protein
VHIAYVVYTLAFWVLLPTIVTWCLIAGDRSVRLVSAAYAIAAIATLVIASSAQHLFTQTEMALALVDIGVLVTLATVALRSNLGWIYWSTAFQTIAVASHLTRALDPGFAYLPYAIMEGFSSYPVLILLIYGLWRCRSDRRRANASRSSISSR